MRALLRLAWFCGIGGATSAAYAILAWTLTAMAGWPAAFASAVAYAACSLGSFAAHKALTFKSSAPVAKELRRYGAAAAFGYGLAIVLPLLLTQMLRFDPLVAIVLVCGASSLSNFILLNFYVFKPAP